MDSSKVKIEGNANLGDLHRAIGLSRKLVDAGLWDGQSTIVWASARIVVSAIAETQLTGTLAVTPNDYRINKEQR